jgi:hypothetical protein
VELLQRVLLTLERLELAEDLPQLALALSRQPDRGVLDADHELEGGRERLAEAAVLVDRDGVVLRRHRARGADDEDDLDRDRGGPAVLAARVGDGGVLVVDDVAGDLRQREGELEEGGPVFRVDRDGRVVSVVV